jgi:hypothetical protein
VSGTEYEVKQLRSKIVKGLQSVEGAPVKVASFTYACARGSPTKPSRQAAEKVAVASSKVGCLYKVSFWICQAGDGSLLVKPHVLCEHTNHVPGSTEDALLLRPAAHVEERALKLLGLGLSPVKVRYWASGWCAVVLGCQLGTHTQHAACNFVQTLIHSADRKVRLFSSPRCTSVVA